MLEIAEGGVMVFLHPVYFYLKNQWNQRRRLAWTERFLHLHAMARLLYSLLSIFVWASDDYNFSALKILTLSSL
jgi:hypothetical protein